MHILIRLFITFFKIGAFSFGGGYAMLTLLEEEVVQENSWLASGDFIDILAISEMTPGPIAINSATFIGYKVAGVIGASLATLGVVLPSFIIISIIFRSLYKFKNSPYVDWVFGGIRPVSFGLIAAAAVTIGKTALLDIKAILIAVLLFYVVTFKKLNPILGVLLAGILGILFY